MLSIVCYIITCFIYFTNNPIGKPLGGQIGDGQTGAPVRQGDHGSRVRRCVAQNNNQLIISYVTHTEHGFSEDTNVCFMIP